MMMLTRLLICFCLSGLAEAPEAPADLEAAPPPAAAEEPQAVSPFFRPGFTPLRIQQIVVVVAGFGLCCVWFTLVARAQALREGVDGRSIRLSNTLNFLTFGLTTLPAIIRAMRGDRGGAVAIELPEMTTKKTKKKSRAKAKKIVDVVFNSPEGQARQPGVGAAVNASKEVIAGAVLRGATDIHLEPKGSEIQIRYRVDGELFTAAAYGSDMASALLSSLKVAADMDIAERRKPQDGSFNGVVDGKSVDFRVSTAPSSFGETMVIRVLDKALGIKRLENLGFQTGVMEKVRRITHMSHGMLIVCGPTGSGKSTTLYAALSELDVNARNIITIENPIEYHLPNVTQTAVNEKAGVTFASVLRSSLRRDPDVLMVGEIRDGETAKVAMQAAMTGHFVFTTLHANNSVASVFRLLDLGLEPFMVSSALTGVLAQRLVKMLCSKCKEPYVPKPNFIELAQKHGIQVERFYKPVGCEECNGLGYRGRLGVFELLEITDRIRVLVQGSPELTELQAAARDAGTIALREDALIKASNGLTSVEQVLTLTTN